MAKRTKEEQSLLDKEYQRQLYNLKRRVKTKVKAGYIVPDTIIPKRPKVINPESILNLTKRTGEYIARKSAYIMLSGKKIKGKERLKQERSERSKKGAETRKRYVEEKKRQEEEEKKRQEEEDRRSYDFYDDYVEEPVEASGIILQNLIDMFENWQPLSSWSKTLQEYKTRDRNRGLGIIYGAIENLGKKQVAINAENNATELIDLAYRILYESGNAYRDDSRNGEINLALNRLASILYARNLSISESIDITELSEMNETF